MKKNQKKYDPEVMELERMVFAARKNEVMV